MFLISRLNSTVLTKTSRSMRALPGHPVSAPGDTVVKCVITGINQLTEINGLCQHHYSLE